MQIIEPLSISKLFDKAPSLSLFKLITTNDLLIEIDSLKKEFSQLRKDKNHLQMKDLELETKIFVLAHIQNTDEDNPEYFDPSMTREEVFIKNYSPTLYSIE